VRRGLAACSSYCCKQLLQAAVVKCSNEGHLIAQQQLP
jgi:hypothetical protein